MFLVIVDRETGEVLYSERHSGHMIDYFRVRCVLEGPMGFSEAFSPLEDAPKGARHVVAYTCHKRDGVGRTGGNFQEWAVI